MVKVLASPLETVARSGVFPAACAAYCGMTLTELRAILDHSQQVSAPHVERLTVAAAVISEVLRQHGMVATLVGGGAIEFHAPGAYTTSDLDFVVEGRTRAELDAVLLDFGFARRGRHWVRGDLFVEVPGNWMSDPVDVVRVGALTLRVVRREIVLADRIIGFKHWRSTAYGAQALTLLRVLGASLDEGLLRERLLAEDAEDAYIALRAMAETDAVVDDVALDTLLHRLHTRGTSDGLPGHP